MKRMTLTTRKMRMMFRPEIMFEWMILSQVLSWPVGAWERHPFACGGGAWDRFRVRVMDRARGRDRR